MSVSNFPTAATIGIPLYNYYNKLDPAWDEVTVTSDFEDGGRDTNLTASAPAERWEIELDGLTETQAKVVMDHYNSAKGQNLDFSFVEPRNFPYTTTGSTVTGVRYEKYEHTRPQRKYWSHSFRITLIKRLS